ncbi:hypothetical protein [Methylobacterium sp. JK268]
MTARATPVPHLVATFDLPGNVRRRGRLARRQALDRTRSPLAPHLLADALAREAEHLDPRDLEAVAADLLDDEFDRQDDDFALVPARLMHRAVRDEEDSWLTHG